MRLYDQNRPKGFTTNIDNEIWNDKEISYSVRDLYAWMWGKPHNWHFSVWNISKTYGRTTATIAKYLRILEAHGLIRREQKREGGRFSKIEYTVVEYTAAHRMLKNGRQENRSFNRPLKVNINTKNKEKKEQEIMTTTPTTPTCCGGHNEASNSASIEDFEIVTTHEPKMTCTPSDPNLLDAESLADQLRILQEQATRRSERPAQANSRPNGAKAQQTHSRAVSAQKTGYHDVPNQIIGGFSPQYAIQNGHKWLRPRKLGERLYAWPSEADFNLWLNIVYMRNDLPARTFYACQAIFRDRDIKGGVDADGIVIINWKRYFLAIIRKQLLLCA